MGNPYRADNSGKVIYELSVGGTAEWSRPYRLAGYDVRLIDPEVFPFTRPSYLKRPVKAHGVLLRIPCTEFVVSGARWWAEKDPALLENALRVAREFLDFKDRVSPEWWALEQPVGRLHKLIPELGRPAYTFNPCDFGDPYTKRTCIWGTAAEPERSPVEPTEGTKMGMVAPGPNRKKIRAAMPQGFSFAFFDANP